MAILHGRDVVSSVRISSSSFSAEELLLDPESDSFSRDRNRLFRAIACLSFSGDSLLEPFLSLLELLPDGTEQMPSVGFLGMYSLRALTRMQWVFAFCDLRKIMF